MRGRTNITQRSGTVPVNGDIKEYVVADGNEIKVGDFVKYGTISSEVVLHDNSSTHLGRGINWQSGTIQLYHSSVGRISVASSILLCYWQKDKRYLKWKRL